MREAADAYARGNGRDADDVGRIETALLALRKAFNATQAFNNINQVAETWNTERKSGLPPSVVVLAPSIIAVKDDILVIRNEIADALDLVRGFRS
jgi:hypothetical protein